MPVNRIAPFFEGEPSEGSPGDLVPEFAQTTSSEIDSLLRCELESAYRMWYDSCKSHVFSEREWDFIHTFILEVAKATGSSQMPAPWLGLCRPAVWSAAEVQLPT